MYLKCIFIFLTIYSKSLFAESYFDNLDIINNYKDKITYAVEVVKSQSDQEIGLMYRNRLKEKTGMLFIFKKEKKATFWMKNTYIPLDIIFIKEDGSIDSIKFNAEPLKTKKIKSKDKIAAVLEINAGEAKKFNFNINSIVRISKFIN
ncbi:MAG: DUF192 domain-containing protein [Pseudomonadota bacterium]|nr:DUF192 domain-containing protein [Pseudomonadota bacterium]MEC7830752.1 DUF192 domain-containing protein [Pseudomonadota bacterium]MEC9382644.1 DUF192 domain-containing protein [Pseudomonadota bacterium]